ncbi:hypothetical protein GCM10023321_56380 [Pseudonocardia eucalypti]|uniref:Secreted protein n=1 Tax=Pseudonocardia eucalypti TaxID=648755 RepID=A0ABP9QQU2_9PSEU|nr:uncharacterized protein YcfJ [Pseudonocardia eucalypti]
MNNVMLTLLIILGVVVVLGLAAGAFYSWRGKRTDRLRERFGPEYDRVVDRADDRGKAESELREREKRHSEFELRPLEPEARGRYEIRWQQVQGEFVDNPARAVRDADELVTEVMSARGYPVRDFDQRADDLSVEHPELTQRYRSAREIARANENGEASTEQLRDATTSYRSLVQVLLEDKRTNATTTEPERS